MAVHKAGAGVLVSGLQKEWCPCSLAGRILSKTHLVASARDGICLIKT